MTRKTIQSLSRLLTCVILVVCISGCEKNESDNAADQANDIISNSNRLIKASSDQAALTQQEMNKIKNIPANSSSAALNQQRQRIAEEVTSRLTQAVGEFPFDDINAKMEELKNMPIETEKDFEAVCNEMIGLTGQIIEYSNSHSNALSEIGNNKLDTALNELSKVNSPINKVTSEQGRRNSLKSASSLALTSIYLTKARDAKAKLAINDTNIHPLLLEINTLIHEVRKCNTDIANAKSSKPVKAIEDLREQLVSAKKQLDDLSEKATVAESKHKALETEYNEYIKKAEEFRNKYLDILNQADKAQGSEKYKLQIEATIQRVGTDNMKNWAKDWIKQGKDTEMEAFVYSSEEISGGIHYETKAELVKLQLNSVATEIDYFTKLANNTENRIIQLEDVINKLETSPTTTVDIENRITDAESRKASTIDTINASLENLKQFEINHQNTLQKALSDYEKAKDSLKQYSNVARGFGEFEPEEINNILQREIQSLWIIDVDFYNSSIGVLDSIRSLPEMSDTVVGISDEFTQKASVAQTAANQAISEITEDSNNDSSPASMMNNVNPVNNEDTPETDGM